MDEPGPVGRRLPGLGRARRLPRDRRGRGAGPGAAGAAPSAARAWRSAWFPFGVHLIEGLVQHGAQHRVDGPAARGAGRPRHARRRARPRDQQPGRRRRPARSTRCRTTCDDAARLARPARAEARSPPSSSSRSTRCGARSTRRPRRSTRWPLADREDDAVDWLERPRRRAGLADRPAARGGRRRRRLVRAGGRRCSTGRPLEPGLEWVASTLSA